MDPTHIPPPAQRRIRDHLKISEICIARYLSIITTLNSMSIVTIEVSVHGDGLLQYAEARAMKDELRTLLEVDYPTKIHHVAVTIGGIAYIEVFHEVAPNVVDTVGGITVRGQQLTYLDDYASAGHRTIWEPRQGHEETDRQALEERLAAIVEMHGNNLHNHIRVIDTANEVGLEVWAQVRITKDRRGNYYNRRVRRQRGIKTQYEGMYGFIVHTTQKKVLVLTGKIFSQHALDGANGIGMAQLHVVNKDNDLVEEVPHLNRAGP